MSKRTKYTLEEKIKSVDMFLSSEHSLSEIKRTIGADVNTLKRWIHSFKSNGIDGLKESHTWQRYSKELKQVAVKEYLEGKVSLVDCCEKYNISSTSVLRVWISKYNNSSELKDTTGGQTQMKAGRKTTFEERIEIVEKTIAKDNNYTWACEEYNVSYNQVYNWVRKFKAKGVEGLKDNRGKQLKDRDAQSLSLEERQALELSNLKKQLADKEMENAILKKLYALQKAVKK